MSQFTMPQIDYGDADWTAKDENTGAYILPTYEPDEKKVREDLQAPLNVLKTKWNYSASDPAQRTGETVSDQLEAFCRSFGGLEPKGTYNVANTYGKLDLVWYNGNSYVATEAVSAGEVPGVSAKWQMFGATLSTEQTSGSITANGTPAVKTKIASSPSGQTVTMNLEGAGSLPLLNDTLRTALGLASEKNKIVDLLSLIPLVHIGHLTLTNGDEYLSTISCPGRILCLFVKNDSTTEGAAYFLGGIQITHHRDGHPESGIDRFDTWYPKSVSADGSAVTLRRDALGSGNYTYFAICEPYIPTSQEVTT